MFLTVKKCTKCWGIIRNYEIKFIQWEIKYLMRNRTRINNLSCDKRKIFHVLIFKFFQPYVLMNLALCTCIWNIRDRNHVLKISVRFAHLIMPSWCCPLLLERTKSAGFQRQILGFQKSQQLKFKSHNLMLLFLH